MSAPTPVSSLVHSSTLVAAGAYLVTRLRACLRSSSLFWLGVFSSLALALRCASSLYCIDLKKIIALSTLTQIRLMVIMLSLRLEALVLCHIITHAMFKSSLFISVGAVIHDSSGSQDLRLASPRGSSLELGLPLLRMWGFPFLAGFYSKEPLIMASRTVASFSLAAAAILSVVFTLIYRLRVLSALGDSTVSVSANKTARGWLGVRYLRGLALSVTLCS